MIQMPTSPKELEGQGETADDPAVDPVQPALGGRPASGSIPASPTCLRSAGGRR